MTSHRPRIMLIEPPFYRLYHDNYILARFPLSLGYLASSALEGTDYEVRVYNFDFVPGLEYPPDNRYLKNEGFLRYMNLLRNSGGEIWEEIARAIQDYRPQVVGLTAKSQNYCSAIRIAKIAKSINPETVVILGGPHASMSRDQVLCEDSIDVVVPGEGEEKIVDLLNALQRGGDLAKVAGIIFRRGSQIVRTPDRPFSNELDRMPHPFTYASSVLQNYELYPKTAFRYLFATRGCPYSCTFCGSHKIWTREVRYRSAQNVVDEITQRKQMFGITDFHFDDDTFGVRHDYLKALCQELIDRRAGITWSCETHANLIREDTIFSMKESGCQSIILGIESGNDEMLKIIKKGATRERMARAAELIQMARIELNVFIMIGFPDETPEQIADTKEVIAKLRPHHVIYSIFTPYVGTDLYERLVKEGVVPEVIDFALYNHQSPENFFVKHMSKEEFEKISRSLERYIDNYNTRQDIRFYMEHPGRLLERIRRVGVAKAAQLVWARGRGALGNYGYDFDRMIKG